MKAYENKLKVFEGSLQNREVAILPSLTGLLKLGKEKMESKRFLSSENQIRAKNFRFHTNKWLITPPTPTQIGVMFGDDHPITQIRHQ